MSAQAGREVPLSTLAPKYLHSNSTSHTSPFSAIAVLIDNAYDPDVSAKQFWIDKTFIKNKLCLTFMDNGNGLDHKTMQKMLSFGYSDKTAVKGHKPIGMYGNGFKSGSMRLGKDAIVFSRSKSGMCIGMLSQTYLEEIGAKQIQIPIVCVEDRNSSHFRPEHRASLQDILRHSLFQTKGELLAELDAITSSFSKDKTGTRIIIWNLRRTATDETEFDFETDCYDIRIPCEEVRYHSEIAEKTASYIPETAYSLRAYCSILYLKPRMQMVLRGEKVKIMLIAKSLASTKKDFYTPSFLRKSVPITFGFNTKSKDQYGVMMYHTNRLIKAYERVGCQLRANNTGVGVIGIIECDFLELMHNKQSFIKSDKYRLTINNLGKKLEDYWKEMHYRWKKNHPGSSVPVEDTMKKPDPTWAQCDDCQKWRKIPDGIEDDELPEKWFCWMNPDNQFRSCDVDEEPEDYDDEKSAYTKTFKQQEKKDKKKKGKTTQQSPSTPTTSKSVPEDAERPDSSPRTPSTISQAAVSPPMSKVLPVISSVCSLSASSYALRKRATPSPLTTPKRPRENIQSKVSVTLVERSTSSPSVPVDVEDSGDQTNDIISASEAFSPPEPANTVYDVSNAEQESMEEEEENTLNYIEDGWRCAPECEQLQSQMQQQADSTRSPARSITCSSQTQTENPGGSAEPDSYSTSEAKRSLIKLRQNVGRLLVPYMPFLELDQVNYECDIIDELLEQHLCSLDSK